MKFLWIFDYDAYYVLPLITAALGALGGSGVKLLRKFGVPLIISAAAYSVGMPLWMAAVNAGVMLGIMTIPYGEDIREEWHMSDPVYFAWVHLVGAIYAASMIMLAVWAGQWMAYLFGSLICGIVFGTLTVGSQVIKFPPWKIVEIVYWAALGIHAVLQIKVML